MRIFGFLERWTKASAILLIFGLFVSGMILPGPVALAQPAASELPGPSHPPGPTLQPNLSVTPAKPAAGENNPATPPVESTFQDQTYQLGSGDKLRLVVYGEDDLGGEYLVDGGGLVQLPLLGQIKASGMTIRDFQKTVADRLLSEGYLKDPRVSVEVENYRPFYIIGEVKNAGQYPFVSGMNVLNAIALAGGYTYRADDSRVYVRPNGSSQEIKMHADQTTKINPGDIIRVGERMF